uniref:Uncharacterized protein n=1 Tax=Oryza barthii TaxID=65489 RepID=A0A0D3HEA3_9ORYZ
MPFSKRSSRRKPHLSVQPLLATSLSGMFPASYLEPCLTTVILICDKVSYTTHPGLAHTPVPRRPMTTCTNAIYAIVTSAVVDSLTIIKFVWGNAEFGLGKAAPAIPYAFRLCHGYLHCELAIRRTLPSLARCNDAVISI